MTKQFIGLAKNPSEPAYIGIGIDQNHGRHAVFAQQNGDHVAVFAYREGVFSHPYASDATAETIEALDRAKRELANDARPSFKITKDTVSWQLWPMGGEEVMARRFSGTQDLVAICEVWGAKETPTRTNLPAIRHIDHTSFPVEIKRKPAKAPHRAHPHKHVPRTRPVKKMAWWKSVLLGLIR